MAEENKYAPLKGIKVVDWTHTIWSFMYSTFSMARC